MSGGCLPTSGATTPATPPISTFRTYRVAWRVEAPIEKESSPAAPKFGEPVLEAAQEGKTGVRSVFGGSKAFCSGRVEHPELRCSTTRKVHGACQVSSRVSREGARRTRARWRRACAGDDCGASLAPRRRAEKAPLR